MKYPHSCVRYSVISPGARSCPSPRSPAPDASGAGTSGILAAATDGVKARALGFEHPLQRVEQRLGLGRIVRLVIAHVDVHRHEPMLRPRVNGEMRFGEEHGARDAL